MDARRRNLLFMMFHHFFWMGVFLICYMMIQDSNRKKIRSKYSMKSNIIKQKRYMKYLMGNDTLLKNQTRFTVAAFNQFCYLLHTKGGLDSTKHVSVEEHVLIYLMVCSHYKKNRVLSGDFFRSGETISKCVHRVLASIVRVYPLLLAQPDPVPEQCQDYRWKCFPGCIGALDGTYVSVSVPAADIPRYRSRKGHVSTNVLACCDTNGLFTYVLVGWEGSAADGRVMRDAILRRGGLRVPTGTYYLVDAGYTNSEGFLAPYRGIRYHLKEWGPNQQRPQNYREYFNMRHSQARNVIERSFGQLKKRWNLLRGVSYYPIRVQCRMIYTLFLIQNFMKSTMADDDWDSGDLEQDDCDVELEPEDYIDYVDNTEEWNTFRDNLAMSMYNNYLQERARRANMAE